MTQNDVDPEGNRSDLSALITEDTATVGTLIGHLYRGEVARTVAWRSRLDRTTNWAVILVAAILTWSFASTDNPHYVILIGVFGVTAFLLIEAHRFQEYDIWRRRVRLIQEHVFVSILTPESPGDRGWQAELSDSLSSPRITIPLWKAVSHRLRRIYLALLLILLAAWIARITVFQADENWRQTASIPGLSGEVVVSVVGVFYLITLVVAISSARGTDLREIEE